jgi:hypothetical protein
MSQPTIGRVVHYTLYEGDVALINQRRSALKAALSATEPSAMIGNYVEAGQTYPAQIVRIWGDAPGSSVNLQVSLDGYDTHWATSRSEGEGPGHWAWPTRV